MSNDSNIIGNGSSIFKTLGLMFAGYIISILVAQGVNLHGQETQIIQILGTILGLGLSYIDMKYTNSFFKRNITLEDYIQYGVEHFNMTPTSDECNCNECTCKDTEEMNTP